MFSSTGPDVTVSGATPYDFDVGSEPRVPAATALANRNMGAVPVLAECRTQGVLVKNLSPFNFPRLLLADRVEDAISATERALALARKRDERGHEAYALRLLGEIAAHPHSSESDTAQLHYEKARTLAETLGMRPLVAHCHFGLGRLYRREGRRREADEQVGTAATMYHDLGMRRWQQQANAMVQ